MFGLLEGFFGLFRPGLLDEKGKMEALDKLLKDLLKIPNWDEKIAMIAEPEVSGKAKTKLVDEYTSLVQHIVDTKDQVSMTVMRRYIQMMKQMLKLAKDGEAEIEKLPPQLKAKVKGAAKSMAKLGAKAKAVAVATKDAGLGRFF